MPQNRPLTLAAAVLVALPLALPAHSMTLADLTVPGSMLEVGGVQYGNFAVKIRGKGLDHDLSHYEVVTTDNGFDIQLASIGPKKRGGSPKFGGKIKLDYDVAGHNLTMAALSIAAQPDAVLKVTRKLFGPKKLAKLKLANPGKMSGEYDLTGRTWVHVRDRVRIRGSGLIHADVYNPVPEPGTGLLLAGGLAAIAALARRRRAS